MRKSLITALVMAGVLALPSGASAQSSTATEVRDAALELRSLDRAVQARSVREAAHAIRRNRVHTRRAAFAAAREARRSALAGFRSNRRVVAQTERNLDSYTELVERAFGRFEAYVAAELRRNLSVRSQMLGRTARVVGDLPEQSRAGAFNWLLGEATGTADRFPELFALVEDGDVRGAAREIVESSLELMARQLDVALSRVESIVPTLPEEAQEHVRMALETVRANVEMAMGIVRGVLDGAFGEGDPEQVRGIVEGVLDRIPAGPGSAGLPVSSG